MLNKQIIKLFLWRQRTGNQTHSILVHINIIIDRTSSYLRLRSHKVHNHKNKCSEAKEVLIKYVFTIFDFIEYYEPRAKNS